MCAYTAASVGATGPTGDTGASNYDIAVENGFEGSEADWLLATVGAPGPAGSTGPAGGEGPTGPKGDAGASAYDVAVENGFVGSVEDWLKSTVGETGPRGPEGAAGPQGPTGPEGAEGQRGAVGPAGPTGPEGVAGATGPKGDQGLQGVPGVVGSIKAAYDSETDLRNAHPTGSVGDYYYVSPHLYIWDDTTNDWKNVGEIAGPQGIQGVQGNQGPRGDTGPAGPAGPAGPEGLAGPRGAEGAAGAQGPAGAAGVAGPTGPTGPTGPAGEAGPEGPTGTEGPTGPEGPVSAAAIPFSSWHAVHTSMARGVPNGVNSIGFGYSNIEIIPIAADGTIDISKVVPGTLLELAMSMPFDATIKSIYFTAGNYTDNQIFSLPLTPIIRLYIAEPGSNLFKPLDETTVKASPLGPGTLPARTMVYGSNDKLNVVIPAGTRVIIGALAEMDKDTLVSRRVYIYYTGGVGVVFKENPKP